MHGAENMQLFVSWSALKLSGQPEAFTQPFLNGSENGAEGSPAEQFSQFIVDEFP